MRRNGRNGDASQRSFRTLRSSGVFVRAAFLRASSRAFADFCALPPPIFYGFWGVCSSGWGKEWQTMQESSFKMCANHQTCRERRARGRMRGGWPWLALCCVPWIFQAPFHYVQPHANEWRCAHSMHRDAMPCARFMEVSNGTWKESGGTWGPLKVERCSLTGFTGSPFYRRNFFC